MRRLPPPACAYLHLLDRVEQVAGTFPNAEGGEDPCVTVTPIWKDLDRPQGTGYALRADDQDLADRLAALIRRGDGYYDVEVRTDVDGRTFMSAAARFSAAELRRDLAVLGA